MCRIHRRLPGAEVVTSPHRPRATVTICSMHQDDDSRYQVILFASSCLWNFNNAGSARGDIFWDALYKVASTILAEMLNRIVTIQNAWHFYIRMNACSLWTQTVDTSTNETNIVPVH